MREACRQAGRQTDRQTDKQRERKEKKKKKKISISPPKHGELLACFAVPSILSLSLSPSTYYLTLMPFSFGVDDTSFAPFLIDHVKKAVSCQGCFPTFQLSKKKRRRKRREKYKNTSSNKNGGCHKMGYHDPPTPPIFTNPAPAPDPASASRRA